MVEFVTGNLVTGKFDIFCHQVNCRGKMGAGLAKQIRNQYPEVYKEYKDICNNGKAILGMNHYTYTSDGRICVDMFAQDNYGTDKRYTDYTAFKSCLRGLVTFLGYTFNDQKTVAFPYMIGCGLAGGDWNVILKMIEEFSELVPHRVVIVKLN